MPQEVVVSGLDQAVREIRSFDKKLLPRLSARLKSEITPELNHIRSVIDWAGSELRTIEKIGMFHDGRSSWDGATVGLERATGAKGTVLAIKATGRNKKFGFDYAELAGIRRHAPRPVSREFKRSNSSKSIRARQAGQGDGFIEMLEGVVPVGHTEKPGRFAFQAIVRRMSHIQRKVIAIIEQFADETSYRIRTKDM